jgi:hypothetical protein
MKRKLTATLATLIILLPLLGCGKSEEEAGGRSTGRRAEQ